MAGRPQTQWGQDAAGHPTASASPRNRASASPRDRTGAFPAGGRAAPLPRPQLPLMDAVTYTKTGELRPATSPAAPRRRRTPREGKTREGTPREGTLREGTPLEGGGSGGDGCRGLTPRRRKRYTGPQTPPPEEWAWLDKLQLDNLPLPSEVAYRLETLEPPAAVAYTQGRRAGLGPCPCAWYCVHSARVVCRRAGQGRWRLQAVIREARHHMQCPTRNALCCTSRNAPHATRHAMRHPGAGSSGWGVDRRSHW